MQFHSPTQWRSSRLINDGVKGSDEIELAQPPQPTAGAWHEQKECGSCMGWGDVVLEGLDWKFYKCGIQRKGDGYWYSNSLGVCRQRPY